MLHFCKTAIRAMYIQDVSTLASFSLYTLGTFRVEGAPLVGVVTGNADL